MNDRPKARILLAEDEPSVIELTTILLESRGYAVDNASDGGQVLAKAKETNPDLIVLDIMLPNLNGFEICRQLRADPSTNNIPILILSALVQKGEIEMGIRMGADLYMTKPFQNPDLLANIDKLLKEGRR